MCQILLKNIIYNEGRGLADGSALSKYSERNIYVMADTKYNCLGRDSVCIETSRVLDSCRDRDCFENVKVFLSDFGNDVIDRTTNIRVKDACIASASVLVEPIAFNRGFYTVNGRLYIKVTFEACVGCDRSQEFEGIAVIDKRAVLYGGESNTTVFRSSANDSFCSCPTFCCAGKNTPTATIELVDPVILSVGVYEREKCNCCCVCCCCDVPEDVYGKVDGCLAEESDGGRILTVSIGVFSVVKITREAQYLINATEYCVPDKECVSCNEEDPCSVFKSMAFPVNEFCSTGGSDVIGKDKRCSCS